MSYKYLLQFGVANEWILKQVIEQSNNFKPDDCVVIQLTNCNRHWFFEDVPTESIPFKACSIILIIG